jgi:hypothetical protein
LFLMLPRGQAGLHKSKPRDNLIVSVVSTSPSEVEEAGEAEFVSGHWPNPGIGDG